MQDYESRERLENRNMLLHELHYQPNDFNQWKRVNAGGWSGNLNQTKDPEMLIESQFTSLSNKTVLKGLEKVKQNLVNSSDEVRISALKEAFKFGEEGCKLVTKIVETETGLVQLTAYDLLWENSSSREKQKLLKYISRHPDVCADYIQQVIEPSLIAMQEEHEQRHQTLTQIYNTQELISQQYKPALKTGYRAEKAYQDGSILNTQLDQPTVLVKTLLPDLALISKLFEAKAKKYVFEAQTFAKTIEQTEKALFQIEGYWQELESITGCETSSLKLLQLLELLIAEMQEHLMLLNQTVDRAIATHLQIQHHYNLAQRAANYCQQRAQLDWQEGNENWARGNTATQKIYVDTATILEFSWEQQISQLEACKCYMLVLQSWLSLAKEMKDALKVVRSCVSAQVAQALLWHRTEFPYNTSSIMEQ